ncbi:MAG: lamin tail domain-containing protein [Candidatus Krumholzibacteriia bacterium]
MFRLPRRACRFAHARHHGVRATGPAACILLATAAILITAAAPPLLDQATAQTRSQPGFGSPYVQVAEPAKLLFSEVSVLGNQQEYVEIYNPNSFPVDMSDYYLTDANHTGSTSNYYWRITEGNPTQATVGGGAYYDFHARFPDGFTIPAGATIVVSVPGADAFFGHFGFLPSLELYDAGGLSAQVPDMREIFPGSIDGETMPTFTNTGEGVVLYHWDGESPLVTDIDVFFWGTSTEYRFSKNGVTVRGATYQPETTVPNQEPFAQAASFGNAYTRVDFTEGDQISSGSNGVDGRDELSEAFEATFKLRPYNPAPPPSGVAKLLLTEVATTGGGREFVEIHNPNDEPVDLSDYYLTDAVDVTAGQLYWQVAAGTPSRATIGGGTDADFHARFPAGYTVGAGETIVVSIGGAGAFESAYGFLPALALHGGDTAGEAVPDLREVFPGSIVGDTEPSLDQAGEVVVLYHWSGVGDLVTDVDVFFWGTETSYRFSKTGVTVGGSTYLPETAVENQRPFAAALAAGQSYTRVDLDEGDQVATGSNGVDGRDELSEDLEATFAIRSANPVAPPEVDDERVALRVPTATFDARNGEVFPVGIRTIAGAATQLRIFDLEGRLVITLFDSRFDDDAATEPDVLTELLWDGRDSTFERVPAGLYIVHLSVVDVRTGEKTTKTAPAVVATDLGN